MRGFTDYIQLPNYRIDHAALLLAKEITYHTLDIQPFLSKLDDLSRTVELRLRPGDSTPDQLNRISQFLFEEEGFHGNIDDYYNPRNSFLNDVLTRYTGIPISLSVLFIAVSNRLGLSAYGVGLPGHFIIGCRDSNQAFYLDPFNAGMTLSEAECVRIATNYLPEGMPFSDAFLQPQPNRLILKRMLHNLRHIYLTQEDNEKLLRVLRLEQALTPHDLDLHRDIGILAAHFDQWGEAVRALRRYLYQRPNAEDADTIRELLNLTLDKISRVN